MGFKEPLTQEQAIQRFSLFEAPHNDLHYEVFFKFAKGDSYSGRITATFQLAKVGDLFFDAAVKSIDKVTVNSKTVEPKRNDRFLLIPPEALVQGKNEIAIEFTNDYRIDGKGLHSFIDTDGRQYLYSTCEPYHCNTMLPCFDQPDLKATWTLTAAAPNDWIVINNSRIDNEAKIEPKDYLSPEDQEHFKLWSFQKTLKFSSYLFCVAAGPYLEVKSPHKHRDVEMSCFCRQSLFKFLKEQADEFFEVSRVCMEFYEEFCGYPYPFGKYDHLFCPEHNVIAMENPGAVTFIDNFIFKDATTSQRRTVNSVVVTHELAHMWFGDLVTMKWWNDLWLNESFAEFMSHFANAYIKDKLKTIKFSDVWVEFLNTKGWGYTDDQLSTTHPISGVVRDTHEAEDIFDGVTYAKGASVLRQLIALIGEKNFSAGLKTYFNKYQFTNTVLQDFVDCMQENYKPLDPSYPESLDEWQKQWLQTAGMNELSLLWEPSDNLTETITLKQTAVLTQHPTLRVHKMKIGFFGEGAELLEVRDLVVPAKECVTLTFEGKQKLKGILLNYENEAFIKVRIDGNSAEFFKSNLKNMKDELSRALVWRAFWDMLRDGLMSSLEFVEIVNSTLADEPSDVIVNDVLSYTSAAVHHFTPIKLRSLLCYKVFDFIYYLLLKTDPQSTSRVVSLREHLIGFADSENHVELVLNWFKGAVPELGKYPLGLNDKWAIVELAYAQKTLDSETKRKFYAQVQQEDPSEQSVQVKRTIEALEVDSKQRSELWARFFKQGKDNVNVVAASMAGFNSLYNLEDLTDYHEDFFNVILKVLRSESREYVSTFYAKLYPNDEKFDHYIEKTTALMSEVDEKKEGWFLKILKQSIDNLKSNQKVYLAVERHLKNQFI